MTMKTVAIIQARMGSTRLPGKVLKVLGGKTILEHVIQRVASCRLVGEVVVATSDLAVDDVIMATASRAGVRGFRGSEADVLSRYYHAAVDASAEIIVRITADCPLFDYQVLEQMLEAFNAYRAVCNVDYLSNTHPRTFPRGLDAEIFTFGALEKAYIEAGDEYEREHVTPYFYRHPEIFTLRNFAREADLSSHRWTLDTEEDFRLISEIYNTLYREGEIFSTDAVLDLLARKPELVEINAHVEQKA